MAGVNTHESMRLDGLEPDVRSAVEEVLRLGPDADAAFDADGTIWHGDVGEEFLRELQALGRLIEPPAGDLYAEYERLLALEPARAFAFCVEVMRGLHEEDVLAWSRELFTRVFARRVIPGMRRILDALRHSGARIWIVSASSLWSVRAGAEMLGLDPSRVLAVCCPTDGQGRLTGEVSDPITCLQGKVDALSLALGPRRPAIAFGNSLLDREMLEQAHRAVVVAPVGETNDAVELACARGWPLHRVTPVD